MVGSATRFTRALTNIKYRSHVLASLFSTFSGPEFARLHTRSTCNTRDQQTQAAREAFMVRDRPMNRHVHVQKASRNMSRWLLAGTPLDRTNCRTPLLTNLHVLLDSLHLVLCASPITPSTTKDTTNLRRQPTTKTKTTAPPLPWGAGKKPSPSR